MRKQLSIAGFLIYAASVETPTSYYIFSFPRLCADELKSFSVLSVLSKCRAAWRICSWTFDQYLKWWYLTSQTVQYSYGKKCRNFTDVICVIWMALLNFLYLSMTIITNVFPISFPVKSRLMTIVTFFKNSAGFNYFNSRYCIESVPKWVPNTIYSQTKDLMTIVTICISGLAFDIYETH